ncbi:MAG TPA: hypothetical protein VIH90_02950 [Candidatus Saccharimonadales bacterium]
MKVPGRNNEASSEDHRTGWLGLWELDKNQLIWRRLRRQANGSNSRTTSRVDGPLLRTEETVLLNDLESSFGVIRSHPDSTEPLPGGFEGLWMEVDEADPASSINSRLANIGFHVVAEAIDPSITESTEIAPYLAGPVNAANSDPKVVAPVVLSGITVLVTQS